MIKQKQLTRAATLLVKNLSRGLSLGTSSWGPLLGDLSLGTSTISEGFTTDAFGGLRVHRLLLIFLLCNSFQARVRRGVGSTKRT